MTVSSVPNHQQIPVAIVGAGGKKGGEYFRALQGRSDINIVACVVNKNIPEFLEKANVRIYKNGDVTSLVKDGGFKVAVVVTPHCLHFEQAKELLERAKAHVIIDKPLGLTGDEAKKLHALVEKHQLPPVFTIVQRSVNPAFVGAKELLKEIGEIHSFKYNYSFALPSPTSGWRGNKKMSGGGVVIDMGYHAIDMVLLYFGVPKAVNSVFGFKYDVMKKQGLEDRANISMKYDSFEGEIILDRHAKTKGEEFVIVGEKGRLVVGPSGYRQEDKSGKVVRDHQSNLSKEGLHKIMFEYALNLKQNRGRLEDDFKRNLETVSLIESIYKTAKS